MTVPDITLFRAARIAAYVLTAAIIGCVIGLVQKARSQTPSRHSLP